MLFWLKTQKKLDVMDSVSSLKPLSQMEVMVGDGEGAEGGKQWEMNDDSSGCWEFKNKKCLTFSKVFSN